MSNRWKLLLSPSPRAILSASLLAVLASLAGAREPGERQSFLARNCYDCHQGSGAEANLDLSSLEPEPADGKAFATWVRVFDRIAAGEMPPPDAEPLEPSEMAEFLNNTENWLAGRQREQQLRQGRVRGRRLTNLQLERTLQDLLGIDIPLAREMPAEPKTGAFTTLAEQQSISHFQLEQHLKIVDLALDEAFRRALTPGDEWQEKMSAKKISRTRERTREPEFIDGGAVVWSSRLTFYGRLPATTAKESGWYRFKFRVSSLKQPKEHGVWCTVRTGACVSSAPLMAWVGSFEANREPKEVTFEAWLPRGHMLEIRPGDGTLKMAKFAGGQSANGEGGGQDVPGIQIDWLTMERIHAGPSDADVRKNLFGNLPVNTHKNPARATVESKNISEDGKRLLAQFATRAFRRPLELDSSRPYVEIFETALASDGDFIAALRAGYRAILCSARFLYFNEQPGELDDFAIASRLSYLIWNSLPDAELIGLAMAGQLRDADVLTSQVTRMLAAPAGTLFVKDFASQWLELSEIDFTDPDSKLHPDFDIIVQYSMLDETHQFLQTMLDGNQSVRSFVDCDTTFVNSRLARFYDMEAVPGDRMQRVELKPEYHRGGLLSQGAILKVTANGTNTSPVLRGVWVSDRILGEPIPPPPDSVPAIEPDIRGAKTIREQLEKHRSNAECASCHSKIDPPGFALESFDAAGQWREFYPRVEKGSKRQGLRIDPSYVTARGEPFENFDQFRKLKAADPQPLARNLAEKLIAYGTGASVTFADRREVDEIVEQVRHTDYGMRSILDAVVTSPIFLMK